MHWSWEPLPIQSGLCAAAGQCYCKGHAPDPGKCARNLATALAGARLSFCHALTCDSATLRSGDDDPHAFNLTDRGVGMGLIARLARRRISSQLDSPQRTSPGPYPCPRDRKRRGAEGWQVCHQAVQPSPLRQRPLAHRPGEAGCPPAYISPEWLRSMRPVVESG
jgi:hypothetical protein